MKAIRLLAAIFAAVSLVPAFAQGTTPAPSPEVSVYLNPD